MARKPRIEYAGAFYHVLARGNQRQRIFKDPGDYRKYLDLLVAYQHCYPFRLYAYVLMDNHVHLLVETVDTPLSKILQGIHQSYTQHFNRKYRTVGHLFQGRYQAILCDRDRYLLALLKYIHSNPLRARVVKALEQYPWSSHRAYLLRGLNPGLLETDRVLRMFSEHKSKARRQYAAFMGDGVSVPKAEIYATVDQRILGDEPFVESVREHHPKDDIKGRKKRAYTMPQIAAAIERAYPITLHELRSWSRRGPVLFGRRVFSLVAKEYGYKGREIAEYLQKDPAAVTGYLRRGGELGVAVERVFRWLTEER